MTSVQVVRVRPSPEVREWSNRHGFTPELVARWVAFHPRPERLLESLLRPTPRYLRVNTLRVDPGSLVNALEARGFSLGPMEGPDPGLPVYRVDGEPFALASTPEHLMGQFYVQDMASLTAPAALGIQAGVRESVLDLAAAPGGKTTAIAQLARDHAPVLAVEPVPHRAAALTANLRRLGITSVAVKLARGESLDQAGGFQRILLDAPCTGEGVLPRDPERRTGDLSEHEGLAALQRRLVSRAVELLEPGGVLVYSACTFSPEECEGVVEHAVALGLEGEPLPFSALGGIPLDPALEQAGDLVFPNTAHARRVYPDRHRSLGFFLARFRKPEDAPRPAGVREGVKVPAPQESEEDAEAEAEADSESALAEATGDEGVEVEA